MSKDVEGEEQRYDYGNIEAYDDYTKSGPRYGETGVRDLDVEILALRHHINYGFGSSSCSLLISCIEQSETHIVEMGPRNIERTGRLSEALLIKGPFNCVREVLSH